MVSAPEKVKITFLTFTTFGTIKNDQFDGLTIILLKLKLKYTRIGDTQYIAIYIITAVRTNLSFNKCQCYSLKL